ncbi:MAG: nucleotidyltransferase domain-containing protein [Myxococcales bacterium]|nr:nucleotidyltransferase domain-containing protein [Myxococcales bacterium]
MDPLAVPLPSGTEVTTRFDQVAGELRAPKGSVGRVVAKRGEHFEVLIVGLGTFIYTREQLRPRKVGQARFAVRREAAWSSLRGCAVLETVVGSRAWGLADSRSDTDLRGVYVLPLPWTVGLADPPRDLVSTDGSQTYWESGKAIQQAMRADPNTLEMLFVESATPLDEIGEWLLAEREAFVSREIYGSFGRYALSQLDRLSRTARLAEHQSTLVDWLREPVAPSMDDVVQRLAVLSGENPKDEAALERGRDFVKQVYRSLYDRGLIPARDFATLAAYARAGGVAPDDARSLRPKNAYNLLRLIATAISWLRDGRPTFAFGGEFRERLLAIKRGDVALHDVLTQAEALTPELDELRRTTVLPKTPDVSRADLLARRIGKEAARRWSLGAPGPLGRDATEPPDVQWEALVDA